MDRKRVFEALRAHVRDELDALERMATMAADEVTSDEAKPENKYDTRGLEASYLARGQAERVVDLRRQLGWLQQVPEVGERVGLGTVVELECEERTRFVVLVAAGGGMRVTVDGAEIAAITPESPLGQALIGCEEGDEVGISGQDWEVTALH